MKLHKITYLAGLLLLTYAAQTQPINIEEKIEVHNQVNEYYTSLKKFIETGLSRHQVKLGYLFIEVQNQVYDDFDFVRQDKMSFSSYLAKIQLKRRNLSVKFPSEETIYKLPIYTLTKYVGPPDDRHLRKFWIVRSWKIINGSPKENVFWIGAENFKIYNVFRDFPSEAKNASKDEEAERKRREQIAEQERQAEQRRREQIAEQERQAEQRRREQIAEQERIAEQRRREREQTRLSQSDIDWWNDLNNTWKKVFNKAIDKGKVTTTPNKEELERIMNLQKLYCSYNKITDLSPLKNLTQLQELDCGFNQITDLSPLKNLTQLQLLDCRWNRITDLSPLKNLTQLKELGCSGNKITDLSPLQNLTQLQKLRCDFNQISDLSPLKNLTQLQKLRCDFNQITDLPPLKNLTKLEYLGCSGNDISRKQRKAFKRQHRNCKVVSK